MTEAAIPSSRSLPATRRTFSSPPTASSQGAKAIAGGRSGRPTQSIIAPSAARSSGAPAPEPAPGPTNTRRSSSGDQTSTRDTSSASEHSATIVRASVSTAIA